jgi:hypothetical protein
MYAVRVENEERGMAWTRTLAEHTAVVELNCQPQRLQRRLDEVSAGPLLH